jgi:hypothetical protein
MGDASIVKHLSLEAPELRQVKLLGAVGSWTLVIPKGKKVSIKTLKNTFIPPFICLFI